MDPLASLTSVAAIGWEIIDRFHIGDRFAVSPHGVGIALGYLAGAYVFMRESARRGYPEDASSSIVFWALIGAIVGARIGYVITHVAEFDNPADVLAIWRGGISQLGGVVGAIAVSYVVVRRRGLSFLDGLDAAAIPIPLGVVIGRVGDLVIGDHLGRPASWALAWTYHGGNLAGYNCVSSVCTTALAEGKVQIVTPAMAELRGPTGDVLGQGVGVHQTAMYDFIATMGLVLLLVYLNRNPRRAGILFFTYIAWYGAGRIITDFLRVENRFLGLTGSQWTSLVAVVLAAAMLAWYAARPQRSAAPDLEVTGGG